MPATATAAKFVGPVEPPPEHAALEHHHLLTAQDDIVRAAWRARRWWVAGAGPLAPQLLGVLGWAYLEPNPVQAPVEAKLTTLVQRSGFPWWCFDECGDGMCIVNGCRQERQA